MLSGLGMNETLAGIRIAVVEDRREERERIAQLLNSSRAFSDVAACRSAEEALELLPAKRVEIVLMDIQLPGLSGIECVRQLKAILPNVQIMMLTVFEDHERIFQSLAA